VHFVGKLPFRISQISRPAFPPTLRYRLLTGTALLAVSGAAYGRDLTVTNGGDLLPFPVTPTTYRQAVQQANTLPGADRILFSVDRVLTNATIEITDSLIIGGTGAPVRIDGAGHFVGRTSFFSADPRRPR